MKRLHVLIIDDDRIYALGLKTWLKRLGLHLCAKACDAVPYDEESGAPDLVLVDPEMAGIRHAELLREIRRRYPQSRIVVLSRSGWFEEGFASAAMTAGADAFFRKGQPDEELFLTLASLAEMGARRPPRAAGARRALGAG